MTAAHRLLARLIPGRGGEWVTAHGTELEAITDRGERRRWIAGLPLLAVRAAVAQLLADPPSFRGGVLMRTVVATLSAIEIAAGGALAVLAVVDGAAGPAVFAFVLLLQGGFTLLVLAGWAGTRTGVAAHVQLAGSAAAVFVGLAGFAAGAIGNIGAADPEYAPMTILLLMALHGLASIATFRNGPHIARES